MIFERGISTLFWTLPDLWNMPAGFAYFFADLWNISADLIFSIY